MFLCKSIVRSDYFWLPPPSNLRATRNSRLVARTIKISSTLGPVDLGGYQNVGFVPIEAGKGIE